jgi:putative zinc ribbon protein
MAKTNQNCQSCGMPLKKSLGGGGTNADGTISTMYCSYCYENGQFNNRIGRYLKGRIS